MSSGIRALSLFDEYVELTPARRQQALADLRRTDPALHHALAALLAADAADHPLDVPPVALLAQQAAAAEPDTAAHADPRIGTRLGAWRIERVIGAGGMGTVYEAQRDDGQYQQRVALKCIRTELSSPTLIAAFLNERNNLAQLEHPHIASLLDGGVEADGHPWFAMRYVDGRAVDQWCDERNLPIRERVRMLVQACDALAYAHGMRVLHQDIKPSNLLVTPQGQVQLLDFGLSSALPPDPRDAASAFAVSLGYAAPELLAGGRASVVADIYAMGVVMYRLLCGEGPVPASPSAHLAGVAAQAPRPMDALAAAGGREAAQKRSCRNPRRLARALADDLCAIGLKCVATAPERRYAHASELREDLLHWLAHRPVQARVGGTGYRTARWLRRHRLPASLAATVALALAGGLGVAAWQRHLAAQEAEATRVVGRLFERTLGAATLSGLSDAPFSTQALLAQTEAQLRQQSLAQDHPALMARSLAMLARSHAVAGDYRQATRLAREADALTEDDPVQKAGTQATLASLLNLQPQPAQAAEIASAGLARIDRGGYRGEEAGFVRIRLLMELARAQWDLAQHETALATLETAMVPARLSSATDPEPLAELLTVRGRWYSRLYWLPNSEKDLRQAIALAEDRNPLLADTARQALVNTLNLMERGEEALTLAQALLESRRRTLGEHHPDTGRAWVMLAANQFTLGRRADAIASLARGQAILRATMGPRHPDYVRSIYIEIRLMKRGDRSERIRKMREAVALLEQALGPTHEATLSEKRKLSDLLLVGAETLPSRAEREAALNEAIRLLEDVLRISEQQRLPQLHAKILLARALILRARSTPFPANNADLDLAERLLETSIHDAGRYFGPRHSFVLAPRLYLAEVHSRRRRYAQADAEYAALTTQAEAMLPYSRAKGAVVSSLQHRARNASAWGRPREEVRQHLDHALARAIALSGEDDITVKRTRAALDELERTGKVTGFDAKP